MAHNSTLYCSFCAASQHDVKKLIAGPRGVFICDECTGLCFDIIHKEGDGKTRYMTAADIGAEPSAPDDPDRFHAMTRAAANVVNALKAAGYDQHGADEIASAAMRDVWDVWNAMNLRRSPS